METPIYQLLLLSTARALKPGTKDKLALFGFGADFPPHEKTGIGKRQLHPSALGHLNSSHMVVALWPNKRFGNNSLPSGW